MTMNPAEHDDPERERLDEAVSARLARLRSMPVDLSALRAAVEAQVGAAPRGRGQGRRMVLGWLNPTRAAAASLLILGMVVVLVIASSSGPVLASPDRLAQIHRDVVSGGAHGMRPVTSIDAANAALASENPGGPAVPGVAGVADDHVMACCVHTVGRKKMSCVSLMTDGVPVSLAVADAADIRLPASETVTVEGVTYHVQSAQDVNMAMTERNGRWVCLMGKLPTGRLIEIAKGLRF
jgi:hypothetical protein